MTRWPCSSICHSSNWPRTARTISSDRARPDRVRENGSMNRFLRAACVVVPLVAAAPAAASPEPADRALDRTLSALVATPGGPPGVVAVVQRGGRVMVHRAGVADVA